MKKAIIAIIGLTCCVSTTYAAGISGRHRTPLESLSLSGEPPAKAFLSAANPSPIQALPQHESSKFDLGALAYKISYVGSLILTADRVVRSVDSVLDGMQVTRDDGTRLKLLMEPGSRGFDVMIRMSRPLEF
jgi:hypothetical protein